MDREIARQLFHITVGLIAIGMLWYLGRESTIGAIFFIVIIGVLFINIRLQGARIPIVNWFEEHFEREDALTPGWGSACYATGALLAITFISGVNEITAILFILALGDGVSTIIGRYGRIKLPYNGKKTLEGSVALFFVSLPAYLFVGPLILPLAVLAAITESLPLIDDNLSIPIICVLFLRIFLMIG